MVKNIFSNLSRGFFYSFGRFLFILFVALCLATIIKLVCHDSGSTLVDPDSLHTFYVKRGATK